MFYSDSSRRFGDYHSNHQADIGVVDPGLGHEQSIVEGAKKQIDYDVRSCDAVNCHPAWGKLPNKVQCRSLN